MRVKAKLFFAWYDIWIGIFIDRKNHAIYIILIPTLGIKIWISPVLRDGPWNLRKTPEEYN